MIKLKYRFKVNHRVSVFVYFKLWIRTFFNYLASIKLKTLPKSEIFSFIIGCGNSGTTLLASKLGLNSQVLLINRESNLFFPSRSLKSARLICNEWLEIALQENRFAIVEKSPKHVHCIDFIRRLLPDSKLIIVTRNPLDTCASLYKRIGDLNLAIERWKIDSIAALGALQLRNTFHVRYETLTEKPSQTLEEACQFLNIEWQAEILSMKGSKYGSSNDIRPNMAIRSAQVSEPIKPNNNVWRKILTQEQADLVRTSTRDISHRLGYEI